MAQLTVKEVENRVALWSLIAVLAFFTWFEVIYPFLAGIKLPF